MVVLVLLAFLFLVIGFVLDDLIVFFGLFLMLFEDVLEIVIVFASEYVLIFFDDVH